MSLHQLSAIGCLLFAMCARAQSPSVLLFGRPASGSSVTYLIKQGFEGAGYDNSETWATFGGDPDPDSASNTFEGSHSLHLDASTDTIISPAFAGQTTVWAYLTFYSSGAPSLERNIAVFYTSDETTLLARVALSTSRAIVIYNGATTSTSGYTASASTRYHVWLKYVAGSGANGVTEVYVNTTDTKPAVTASIPNGSATGTAAKLRLGANSPTAGVEYWIDKVRVDDAEIGSAPE